MILDGGILRFLWLQQAVVVGGIFVKFSPLMSFIPNSPLGKTIFLHCACSEHSCPLPQHILHLQEAQRAGQGPSEGGRGHPPAAAPGYSSCPLLPLTFGPRDASHLSAHSLDNRNFQCFPKHGWIGEHGFRHCLLESWGSSGEAGSRKLYLGTLTLHPSPGAFLSCGPHGPCSPGTCAGTYVRGLHNSHPALSSLSTQ